MGHEQVLVDGGTRALFKVVELVVYGLVHEVERMERQTSLSRRSSFSSDICLDRASEYIFLRTSFSRSRCSFS